MGHAAVPLEGDASALLAVPLHGIHGLASLLLELAPADAADAAPIVCRLARLEVL
jgi:hypothetical protein